MPNNEERRTARTAAARAKKALPPSQQNEIEMFFHCIHCLTEKPADQSPREWCHNEVDWTPKGFQVWCVRHERNVVNVDFLGQKMAYRQEEN